MALISRLGVVLGLDSAEFVKGLGFAEAKLGVFGRNLKTGLGAAVVAVGAEMIAAAKYAADYADTMSKTAQKIGITTESLSALKYAGELADVSFETLQTGLKKLSVNMVGAVSGKKEMIKTFDTLKISVKDANGNLKATDVVLAELADRFEKMPDGPAKTALAVKALGKAGNEMIPLLNGGSRELKKAREEAEHFGLIVGTDFGKQAEAFEDNMDRMKLAAQGLQVKFGNTLIPALSEVFEDMLMIEKEHGLFVATLYGIGDALDKAFFGSKDTQQRNKVKDLNEDLTELQRRYATLTSAKSRNFYEALGETGRESWIRAKMTMEHDINALEAQIRGINADILARKNKSALPPVGRPDKAEPDIANDEADKLNKQLDKQLATMKQQRETLGRSVSEVEKMKLEFAQFGQYADLANTAAEKRAIKEAEALDLAKHRKLVEKVINDYAVEREKIKWAELQIDQQQAAHELIRLQQHKDANRFAIDDLNRAAERLDLERSMAGMATTQVEKALELFDLETKLNQMKRSNGLYTKQELDDYEAAEKKRIEANEQNKRAQKTFQAGWNKAYNDFVEKAQDSAALGAEAFNSMASSMENALDTFVTTGKFSFSSLTQSIIQDLLKIQLRAQMSGIFGSLFGGGSSPSGMGNIFTTSSTNFGNGGGILGWLGGFFADGGEPPLNKPSVVGESGPELFIPKTSGTIIPNNQLSSALGSQPQVVYNGPYIANLSAIDTQSAVQFLAKNKTAVWSANQSAQRSLPQSR